MKYFWTCGLEKTWLDKCLKSPVSDDHSKSNMVNEPKSFSNMKDSTFTLSIDHCEGNSVRKCLS